MRIRRALPVLALAVLTCTQSGCGLPVQGAAHVVNAVVWRLQPHRAREMPHRVWVYSTDDLSSRSDSGRLAHCSAIEIAIASPASSIAYGQRVSPGEINGFVLKADEFDQPVLEDIQDRVGLAFVRELERAFPGKKVSYLPRGTGLSTTREGTVGNDPDQTAVCLLSYTYVICAPKTIIMGGPIWRRHRGQTCKVLLIESTPPLLMPRVGAYVPGTGWARDTAFFVGSRAGRATGEGFSLDCTAEVKLFTTSPWRPEEVRLDAAAWESAVLKWAEQRAADLARQLRDDVRTSDAAH